MYRYYTKGVCSKSILMDIEDDILKDVIFEGGCSGNLIGIKHLIEGKSIDEIIEDLEEHLAQISLLRLLKFIRNMFLINKKTSTLSRSLLFVN